jgi:hypothetical protein
MARDAQPALAENAAEETRQRVLVADEALEVEQQGMDTVTEFRGGHLTIFRLEIGRVEVAQELTHRFVPRLDRGVQRLNALQGLLCALPLLVGTCTGAWVGRMVRAADSIGRVITGLGVGMITCRRCREQAGARPSGATRVGRSEIGTRVEGDVCNGIRVGMLVGGRIAGSFRHQGGGAPDGGKRDHEKKDGQDLGA